MLVADRRRPCPFWLLAVASATLCGAPPAAVRAQHPLPETYLDFRNGNVPPEIQFLNDSEDYVHPEREGLRVQIPKDDPRHPRVVTATETNIRGDLEITLTYEILEAEPPPEGDSSFGVGIMLTINGKARIGWYARPGKRVILWDRPGSTGHRVLEDDTAPARDRSGRLRLQRTGKKLRFLWSPERAGDKFDAIHECFYPQEVTVVRLVAETNKLARTLEARFVDLRIRGGAVTTLRVARRPWFWLALATLLLGIVLGGWIYWRRRRGVAPGMAPPAGPADIAETR
jgi:hypothetical protein